MEDMKRRILLTGKSSKNISFFPSNIKSLYSKTELTQANVMVR